MRRIWRTVLILVSLAAVALPVTGGTPGTTSAAGSLAPHVSVLREGKAVQTTANSMQAGYVTLAANQTEAKGRFVLPSFTCTGTQAFDLSIQLEGPPSSAVGFVTVTCSGTGELPTFQAFACAGTSGTCSTAIAPAPGDTITITDSLTESVANAVVNDQTTNMNTAMTGAGVTTTTNSNFIDQRVVIHHPDFRPGDLQALHRQRNAYQRQQSRQRSHDEQVGQDAGTGRCAQQRWERLHDDVQPPLTFDEARSSSSLNDALVAYLMIQVVLNAGDVLDCVPYRCVPYRGIVQVDLERVNDQLKAQQ